MANDSGLNPLTPNSSACPHHRACSAALSITAAFPQHPSACPWHPAWSWAPWPRVSSVLCPEPPVLGWTRSPVVPVPVGRRLCASPRSSACPAARSAALPAFC